MIRGLGLGGLIAACLILQPGAAIAANGPTSAQKAAKAKGVSQAAKAAKAALAAKKAARKQYAQVVNAEEMSLRAARAAQAAHDALPPGPQRDAAAQAWRVAHARHRSAYQALEVSNVAVGRAVQQRLVLKQSLVSKRGETMATFLERTSQTDRLAAAGIVAPRGPGIFAKARDFAPEMPDRQDVVAPPSGFPAQVRPRGEPDIPKQTFRPSPPNRLPGAGYATVPPAVAGGPANNRPGPGYATGPLEPVDDPVNLRPGLGYATGPATNRLPRPGYTTAPPDAPPGDPVNRVPGPGYATAPQAYGAVDPRIRTAIRIFVPPPEPVY